MFKIPILIVASFALLIHTLAKQSAERRWHRHWLLSNENVPRVTFNFDGPTEHAGPYEPARRHSLDH